MGCFNSKSVSAVSVKIETTPKHTKENIMRIASKDPADQLTDYLKILKKSILSQKLLFDQSYELLCKIVKNIISHYEDEKYKRIKKDNKKFLMFLGKFKGIDEVMKFLGFKDQGQEWVYVDSLGKSYAQMKILDLSIAYNKL